MQKAVGRTFAVSPFRRLVADLMHFGRQVPAVTVDRRMHLAPLIAARASAASPPSWTAIFAKAYSMLGRDYPQLRQSYLSFPWARIYEHPHSVVALNVERRLPDEDVVLFCLIRGAENRSLQELDAIVRHHKEAPVEELRSYQRSLALGRVPSPLRRWFWWAALNMCGRRRCHNFGTFSISSVASLGAGLLHVIPVLTSSLHYGLFDNEGRLDVRITWDHRVMDGAAVARMLADLEAVLTGPIMRELRWSYVAGVEPNTFRSAA
jgi:pyruvate/2-oxoglutarate dehydrogenase complex dihydrolipoamide acyltransferase (E2) component